MKWPSCIGSCLGTGIYIPESEDSPTSTTAKGPSTPGTLSGILSSFMSKQSCSRGTIDTCGTDLGKRRSLGTRGRGDADIVTLATARYVEFFMGAAKNEDVYTDIRGAQDSIRSVRTGSDLPVSRSSTLTGTGRASREASRLVIVHHNPQVQHSTSAFPGYRQPSSLSVDTSSAKTLRNTEPRHPHGPPGPASSYKLGSVGVSHGPCAKKKQVNKTCRSRSDRISSSVAACLLPTPSVRTIARAHTVLPMMPDGPSSLRWSSSMGDLRGRSHLMRPLGPLRATRSQLTLIEASAGAASAAAVLVDTKSAVQCVQHSRLSTERCGSHVSAAQMSGRTGPLPRALGQSEAATTSQALPALGLAAPGSCRRSTIFYCRNGDVEVTGLPPSCLTSGRTPRHRRNSRAACASDWALTLAAEVSAPLLRCQGPLRGRFQRRSVDGITIGPEQPDGLFGGLYGSNDQGPAAFTAKRALASCNPRRNSLDSGLTFRQAALESASSALRHNGGIGPASLPMPSVESLLNHDKRAALGQAKDQPAALQHMCIGVVKEGSPAQVGVQLGQHCHKSEVALDKVEPEAALAFTLANASSNGERGDCCGSSLFVPTRFSDSSRLTPGINTGGPVTPATVSLVLQGMSEQLAPAQVGAAAQPAVVLANPVGGVSSLPIVGEEHQHAPSFATNIDGLGQEPNMTVSPDSFVGFTSGAQGICGGTLFPSEAARNVTSALTRLQEACKAAVAQGDLRSQRLCKRMSADMSSMRPELQLVWEGNSLLDGNAGVRRAPRLGASLVRKTTAGGSIDMPCARTGSAHATLGVCASPAVNVGEEPAQGLVFGSGLGGLPLHNGNSNVHGADGAWGAGACDDEPENTMIMDGSMLEGTHFNEIAAIAEEPNHAPCNKQTAEGTGDEAEEYRTRMLNVLLRGDFFHETCDSAGPASEEEDEGVVEYRYGGFELGGGDGEGADLFRQASFIEAVRRCSTTRLAVAAAAADHKA